MRVTVRVSLWKAARPDRRGSWPEWCGRGFWPAPTEEPAPRTNRRPEAVSWPTEKTAMLRPVSHVRTRDRAILSATTYLAGLRQGGERGLGLSPRRGGRLSSVPGSRRGDRTAPIVERIGGRRRTSWRCSGLGEQSRWRLPVNVKLSRRQTHSNITYRDLRDGPDRRARRCGEDVQREVTDVMVVIANVKGCVVGGIN
jgi:hypothetical protein